LSNQTGWIRVSEHGSAFSLMNHFKSLAALHEAQNFPPPQHPLISLIKCTGTCTNAGTEHTGDFYMIGFKKMKSGTMLYGKTKYDHDRGTMSFVKPRQIIGLRHIELEENGYLLYIHEDFLNGHPLHHEIRKYSYFEYETNEALHLSPREETIIRELFDKIEIEYHNNPDEYSREIILTHIDSILKYAQRFYKRQFNNRNVLTGHTLSKFNNALTKYFENGQVKENGLPTVNHIAAELNLSARYLSDLLKQETGKTAIDLIHLHLISEAKHLLTNADQSVSQIAYGLGFENPPYFSRLFKKEVGKTPVEFRRMSVN
jgi:AraC family transcriptional regulator, transcriptional activator of pobA